MRSRRLRRRYGAVGAVVLGLLGANVIACQLILGIDDHNFLFTPDSAATAPDATEEVAECPHASRPPAQPSVADDGDRKKYVFAMRTAAFTSESTATDDKIPGYDLDGVCSCDSRDNSIHGGQMACTPPPNARDGGNCDYDGGVDNALISLSESASLFNNGENINKEAACGRSTLLVALLEYNGQANDPEVAVAINPSFGIYEGDASVDTPECAGDGGAGGPTHVPRWDGTDRWSFRPGEFNENRLPTKIFSGWVSDSQLVMDTRRTGETNIPLVFKEGVISFGTLILTARLVPDDAKRERFRLEDGIMTGRVDVNYMLNFVGASRIDTAISPTGHLCDSPAFDTIVKPLLCGLRDTVMPPTRDFKSDRCNAISLVMRFTAAPVVIGDVPFALPADDSGACTDRKGSCAD